jgi:hypothetical protein
VHRFDRLLAGFPCDIGCQQPLLDQLIDEWSRLLRNFRLSRHPSARAAGVWIDTGKPGN